MFSVQQGMPQGTPGSLAMFASGLAQRPGAAAAAAAGGGGGVDTPVHPGPGGPSPPFADERAMRERERMDREMRERELRERELRERELRERERMDLREREREREMVVRERERSAVRGMRGGEDRMAVDEPSFVQPSRTTAGQGAARWDASPPAQSRVRPGSPPFAGQQQQQPGYPPRGPPQQQQVPESPRYRYDDAPGQGGAAGWDRERERDRDTRRAANGHGHHHSHSHSAHSTHSHHGHPGAPPPQQQQPQQPGQPTRAGGRDILENHQRDARPEMGSRTTSAAYAAPADRAAYGAERSPMMPTGAGREREFRDREREREFRSSPENRRRSDDRMQVDSRERESWGGAPTSSWDRAERERERERQQQPTPPAPVPAPGSRRYDPRMDGASETGPSPPPRGAPQPRQPSFGGRPEWRERDREREREREQQEALARPELRERPSSPRVGDKRRHEGVEVPPRGRRTPSVNGAPASNGKDKLDSPRSERGTPVRKPLSTSAPVSTATNGNGNGVTRSPTSAGATTTTSRTLDENYDEGVADALIGLASSRPRIQAPASSTSQAPPSVPAPAPVISNFGSAQPSAPSTNEGTANGLKRPLSPEPSSAGSESTNKRQRIGAAESNGATDMTLPPIATLSPTSPASTSAGDDDAKRGSPSRRGASPARSAGSRGSGTAALRSPRGSTPRAEA